MMKHDLFAPKRRIERAYYRSIKNLIKRILYMCRHYRNPEAFIAGLKRYAKSKEFIQDCKGLAGRMVTQLFSDGHKTWRQAANEGSKGNEIYKALQNELKGPVGKAYYTAIQRNAQYISSLPLNMAERATRMAADLSQKGMRASDIAEELQRSMGQLSASRAKLIARTEVSKASTELTRARCEKMGLGWYIWRTSMDGDRVRKSHQIMEGVWVNWNDPPSPEKLAGEKRTYGNYHAGEIFNCRCYPEPVVRLDFVDKWPIKVYHNGKIQSMNKKQFMRIR